MGEAFKILVLVALADESLSRELCDRLRNSGYGVACVVDGASAEQLLPRVQPALLLVDVGLNKPRFPFLCELVREQGIDTKVLLVTSVHTQKAYKRQPVNLYGADQFVESHRLDEDLLPRVRELLGQRPS